MTTFYNDNDQKVCRWLDELVKHGHISDGVVDCSSINDLNGGDLAKYRRVHMFAGIGGWDYALKLAGWPTDRPAWTGSCPCQPFSSAGKGGGTDDPRHLWPEMRRLIAECRPATVFGEQVASKAGREWLAGVRTDLEALGYAVGAADLCAAGVKAPHIRQRLWWVAYAEWHEPPKSHGREDVGLGRIVKSVPWDRPWTSALSEFRAVDHGLPRCVVGTDAARNAIVPQVAAEFIASFLEATT